MLGLALLVAAAALLWLGAELFVDNASSAGRHLGTTGLAVGLLLAGAEPEELITATIAAWRGQGGIAAGDAIGANVTMLTVILGLIALARPIPVGGRVGRYLAGAGALGVAAALMVPNGVSRIEGLILVLLYAIGVAAVWRVERRVPAIGDMTGLDLEDDPHHGPKGLLLVLAGIGMMALGGWVAVLGAEDVVEALGVTESIVGLSLVALATTAELFALAFSAIRRGVEELAVAGLVGSAGYNATVTLGGAALVRPLDTIGILPWAWLAAALPLVVLVLGGRNRRISRIAGAALVLGYVGFLIILYR